jgi:hypothetical protein
MTATGGSAANWANPVGDFWPGSVSNQNPVATLVPNGNQITISVAIPAGSLKGHAIMLNILGLSVSGGNRTNLQRFTYGCLRGVGGVLTATGGFGSGNELSQLQKLGALTAQPAFTNGVVNANSIDFTFTNAAGQSLYVLWQTLVSPPLFLV